MRVLGRKKIACGLSTKKQNHHPWKNFAETTEFSRNLHHRHSISLQLGLSHKIKQSASASHRIEKNWEQVEVGVNKKKKIANWAK